MSDNKYSFKITKILGNNLFEGKITYNGSDLVIIIKLYNVVFLSDKIEKINEKISSLIKRKDLKLEIKEINDKEYKVIFI